MNAERKTAAKAARKLSYMEAKRRNPDNKRSVRIKVSLSEKDYEELKNKAASIGLKASQYVYYLIKNREVVARKPEHTDALRSIAMMGNNLNQLAFNANMGIFNENDRLALRKILIEIDHIFLSQIKG